jgi:dienelactone hydrolase
MKCPLLLCLVAALTPGCVHHSLERPARKPQPLPAEFQEDLPRQPSPPAVVTERIIKTNGNCRVSEVELEAAKPGYPSVKLTYYAQCNLKEPAPAILILPIMGGRTYPLESFFANGFAHHGYHALVVHRPDLKEEIRDLADIDTLLRASLHDTRRIIDWLERQPEVDAKRLGLFGISLGAIRGVMVLGLEPRLRAAVLGLPGGDLPYIATHSEDRNLRRARDKILAKNQLTVEEGEQRLREAITCEPLTIAPAVDPSRVLLVIAAFDKVVPASKGWELRRKMGNPQTVQLCGGHYSSVVHVPYLRGVASRFFEQHFADGRKVRWNHRIPWR